jgi:hypothetical protein
MKHIPRSRANAEKEAITSQKANSLLDLTKKLTTLLALFSGQCPASLSWRIMDLGFTMQIEASVLNSMTNFPAFISFIRAYMTGGLFLCGQLLCHAVLYPYIRA